jgi:hypothetical protein
MNKALKWILYIFLGLLILAILAGFAYMVFGGYGSGWMRPGIRMMDHMRFYYTPVRSIFGGLVCLGLFLLVVVGIVALINAVVSGNKRAQVAPPAPVPAPLRTCGNCGKPAQEDWNTCPYCGNNLNTGRP